MEELAVTEKEKREYCASCLNRGRIADDSGIVHCGRYSGDTERYCIVNSHAFWEEEIR